MAEGVLRPAWADVDLGAIAANAAELVALAAPAALCAVVKADGYGHGAARVASAALEGGASCLAVALVEEGLELRCAGIEAPVLLLSEPAPGALEPAVAAGLTLTVYSDETLDALEARSTRERLAVELKVDTGMHRVGADPHHARRLARRIASSGALALGGVWTHLAVAEDLEDDFTGLQLDRFDTFLAALEHDGIDPGVVHAANSAGLAGWPRSCYSRVRAGLALYGYAPSPATRAALRGVRPALSLKARVRHVAWHDPGTRPSYGRHRPLPVRSAVAVAPLGYADGVPRRLFPAGEVIVGGRRRPFAGMVTMDQLLIDCGQHDVRVGDEVVLLGSQGGEELWAQEWAQWAGTITHEILCGIGPRVPRRYHRSGTGSSAGAAEGVADAGVSASV